MDKVLSIKHNNLTARKIVVSPSLITANLTYIVLINCNIENLDMFFCCTNLTKLILSRNKIIVLTGINVLSKLEVLYLDHNLISDIFPISDLTHLRKLNLAYNKINSLYDKYEQVLEKMIKLTYLNISHNKIYHIHSIDKLPELKYFKCIKTKILSIGCNIFNKNTKSTMINSHSSFSSIITLPNLFDTTQLPLEEVIGQSPKTNQKFSPSEMIHLSQKCFNLTNLNLRNMCLDDFCFVRYLPNLEYFSYTIDRKCDLIHPKKITIYINLSDFSHLINLKHLIFNDKIWHHNYRLQHINDIKNLPKLEILLLNLEIEVKYDTGYYINFIQYMTKIRTLHLNIGDIRIKNNHFKNCKNLEKLNLYKATFYKKEEEYENTKNKEIYYVKFKEFVGCNKLKYIYMHQINNIFCSKYLHRLKNLEYLYINTKYIDRRLLHGDDFVIDRKISKLKKLINLHIDLDYIVIDRYKYLSNIKDCYFKNVEIQPKTGKQIYKYLNFIPTNNFCYIQHRHPTHKDMFNIVLLEIKRRDKYIISRNSVLYKTETIKNRFIIFIVGKVMRINKRKNLCYVPE